MMQIKHLRNSRILLEILILSIVYMSMATGVYIGFADNDAGTAFYCLIVLIPVLVTYLSRKYIKSYPVFMCINISFVFIAAALAGTDIEFAGYVFVAAAIVTHSIRIKNLYVQKKQYERMEKTGYDVSGKSKDDMLMAINASEKLHIAYCIFMIFFYIIGEYKNNSTLMGIQLFLFISFVICQFMYNQINELYKIFMVNQGKSEFPARRIIRINVAMMFVFAFIMIAGMLLFYSGKYGNIFQTIKAGLLAIVKAILWLLLKIIGRGPESSGYYEEEITRASEEFDTREELDIPYNPIVGNALMELVGLCVIIGVFIAIIYAIVKYSQNFRKSLDNDCDEVEYLNKDTEKEQFGIKKEKAKETREKNNIQYRKLYKKYARSKKYMPDNKISSSVTEQGMMPEEITKKYITDDEVKSKIITNSYEKARYSNSEVSKEDIEFLKKL